jgi:hypothetical protein
VRLQWILVAFVLLASARDATSYKFFDYVNPRGEHSVIRWGAGSQPVPWFFYNVPPDDFSVETAIANTQAAFDTWEAVETASISFTFRGQTNAEPFVFFDMINTLGFLTDPDLRGTGILGGTGHIIFVPTGELAEADIFFNADARWSANPNGEAGHEEFQSAALHEIGHFFGLAHSGVAFAETRPGQNFVHEGSSIMFPIAFPLGTTIGRTLTVDDITGVSILYPVGDFLASHASLSGTVTKNGEGLEAAHVTLFNPFTGESIGGFTDQNGNYRVEGLSPGPLIVRVHPISDTTSPESYGYDEFFTDLDWSVTFHEGRAEVTVGNNTPDIDVEVSP